MRDRERRRTAEKSKSGVAVAVLRFRTRRGVDLGRRARGGTTRVLQFAGAARPSASERSVHRAGCTEPLNCDKKRGKLGRVPMVGRWVGGGASGW